MGLRSDVWIYDLGQDVLTPVTTDGLTIGGIWAPDGRHIATADHVGDSQFVLLRRLDGSRPAEPLARSRRLLWPAAWTKDARHLVVMDGGDISIVDVTGDRATRPLIHTPSVELGGRLSPDERWLAYFSNVTGSTELYVTRFPGGGPSWRITRGGAREAVWSRDGRELFFRSENGRQMLTVAIQPGAVFGAGAPRLLFEGDFFSYGGPGFVNYDVTLDGKGFLMLVNAGTESGHLNVVEGWTRMIPAAPRR